MKQMKSVTGLGLAACLLVGCATTGGANVVRNDTTATGQIERGSVNDISYADIRSISNGIIRDIFFKDNVLSRDLEAAAQDPFKVAIINVKNDTTNDRITSDRFLSILEEELLRTGIVELHTEDSPNWEYSIDAELSDTQTGTLGGTRQAIYKMTLTMTSVENVKVGIWSDELQLTGRY